MILKEIIRDVQTELVNGDLNSEIKGVTSNSKEVREGFLFAAIRGDNTDGHKYIDSAIKKGAKAIILEKVPEKTQNNVSYIKVEDTKAVSSKIASNYFKNPTNDLTLVGVTGTNGKTTLTYLIEEIWKEENKNTGIIGTIENRYSNKKTTARMTTPDSMDLIKILNEMKNEGVTHTAMEVSSHSIDRHRVDGCNFDAAVFTNLTQDHLDYHKTLDNYFDTKKKLFTNILANSEKSEKFAVINIDDEYGKKIKKELKYSSLTYSIDSKNADFYASKKIFTHQGISSEITTPFGKFTLQSNLLGKHNLYNLLAAIAVTSVLRSPIDKIKKALSGQTIIPGRLEKVENNLGLNVLVDYAHTPDALENVIKSIKNLNPPRLILVFGCGGDRDKEKRPLMGKLGFEQSDILIITSDNPRTEVAERILDDIHKGIDESSFPEKRFYRIADRKEAIHMALTIAQKGDFVLIAGKGHEDYQIVGTKKYPFDDRKIAKKIITDKEKISNDKTKFYN